MKKIFIYISILSIFLISCQKDFLEVKSSTRIASNEAITSMNDLKNAVFGAYNNLTGSTLYGGRLQLMADLMAEDFYNPKTSSGHLDSYYDYGWTQISGNSALYSGLYYLIADINDVLVRASKLSVAEAEKMIYDDYIAQLKSLRALAHLNICMFFAPLHANLGHGAIKEDALGIQIVTELFDNPFGEWKRNTVKEVYSFVVKEFKEAIPLLSDSKRNGLLNKYGVEALLARTYLYMNDMDNAYKYAKDVIENGGYALIERDVYIDSWKEAYTTESIFELATSPDDNAGINGIGYYVYSDGEKEGYKEVAATKDFIDIVNADPNDVRLQLIVPVAEKSYSNKLYYYPIKKYPGREDMFTNNPKVVRLSEMYLIASESALGKTNPNAEEAAQFLNKIRKRRTTTTPEKYNAASIDIDDIMYERRVELFCKGHRFWDMKRLRRDIVRHKNLAEKEDKEHTDATDGIIEFDWFKCIYPIPERELKLIKDVSKWKDLQNPGY